MTSGMKRLGLVLSGSVVMAFAFACGSSKDRGFDDGTTGPGGANGPPLVADDTIAVEPPDAVLDVEDGQPPPTEGYHAFLVHKDGSRDDITAAASFHVDTHPGQTYGTFAGPTFTAAANGVGQTIVHADYQAHSGQTGLTLRLKKVIIAAGAPSDAEAKFGGANDTNRAPTLVYPPDGVMVPPNMNEIEWQYQPGDGNDLFELGVTGALLSLKVYFACNAIGGGCGYAPDPTVWNIVAAAGRGTDPLSYVIRGTSKAGGTSVGASLPRSIAFGEEDILGGLYYWNAGAGATMRYEFGVSGQKAETYMDAVKAGGAQCVGCHELSRDGERISLGLGIPGPAAFKVFDVGTRALVFGSGGAQGGDGSNFFSFSSADDQIVVSSGVTVGLKDAKTGAVLQDKIDDGAMPDMSPDGTSVVYAKPKTAPPCFPGACGMPGVSEASLYVATKNGATYGNPQVLVAAGGQNAYYPSYSPDGKWVIFNRASVGNDAQGNPKSSYDAPDATVWAIAKAGGTPVALAKATSANGDSWPKWMQRDQAYRGRRIMWVTFSSRRAYGLRAPAGKTAQIWMAAFDPDAAAAGKDPSFSAFWLPFQDSASGNHIAQWVTKVARQGCTENTQCDGSESCLDGVCKPTVH
jgi:hypothetical protein